MNAFQAHDTAVLAHTQFWVEMTNQTWRRFVVPYEYVIGHGKQSNHYKEISPYFYWKKKDNVFYCMDSKTHFKQLLKKKKKLIIF